MFRFSFQPIHLQYVVLTVFILLLSCTACKKDEPVAIDPRSSYGYQRLFEISEPESTRFTECARQWLARAARVEERKFDEELRRRQ